MLDFGWFVVFSSFCQSKFNQIILFIYVFHMFFLISSLFLHVELMWSLFRPCCILLPGCHPKVSQSMARLFFVPYLYQCCIIFVPSFPGQYPVNLAIFGIANRVLHLVILLDAVRKKGLIKDLGRWWEEDGKKFLDCCHVIIMSLQYI